ncbi:hypothetical protein MnTg02_01846 [bacterium MnTg02]|nr:hypothetical protein MnTg02_01846 [bacterium MnTg02]
MFQCGQPIGPVGGARIGVIRIGIESREVWRHVAIGERVAEIEKASWLLLGVVEHAKADLKIGDAAPGNIATEPLFAGGSDHALFRWNPAIAITKQHNQKRPAAAHLREADLEDVQLAHLRFLVGGCRHAEAQVDPFEMAAAGLEALLQLWKHTRAQMVALGLHVREGAADEYRLGSPSQCRLHCARCAPRGMRITAHGLMLQISPVDCAPFA